MSVNTANGDGVYPIHYAVRLPVNNNDEEKTRKRLNYLETLLQLPGVDLCVWDREGLQPIHWAASVGKQKFNSWLMLVHLETKLSPT